MRINLRSLLTDIRLFIRSVKFFVKWKFLPSATKLRRLCFYRRVSVHTGGGVSASVHAGIPPAWEQTPPWSRPPGSRHTPPERRPLLRTARILLECILVMDGSMELKLLRAGSRVFYVFPPSCSGVWLFRLSTPRLEDREGDRLCSSPGTFRRDPARVGARLEAALFVLSWYLSVCCIAPSHDVTLHVSAPSPVGSYKSLHLNSE